MKRDLTWLLIVIGAFAAFAWGCDSNRSGVIRARKLGDLTYALDVRDSPIAALANCAADVPPDAWSVLQRRPYLQQLTAGSLRVVWTTVGNPDAGAVVVSRADGGVAAASTAERDVSARPAAGVVQWSARVVGLDADTLYCYEVRVGGAAVARSGFRTPPAADSDRAVRFVAFGDSGGGGADQRAVTAQLTTVPFDFMIHLGDIAYESGTRAQLESTFFQMYAGLLEHFAVFPVSGNHEYETEGAAPFREAFVLPENGAPAGIERWYSYDWGGVHLVALDSERTGAAQAAWLDADLAANRLPWTIVYIHRPPFSSGDHGSDGDVQRYFVPVLVKHRVALVLSGHDHHYERTTAQSGVTYVVSGGGGRGTRDVGRSSFTAFSESVCHFVFVTIEADRLTGHAIDGVGQEFDSFVVTRSAP
jgi:hypothetical protein